MVVDTNVGGRSTDEIVEIAAWESVFPKQAVRDVRSSFRLFGWFEKSKQINSELRRQ